VQGQGLRKRARGIKGVADKCDKLGYFVVLYCSSGGPLSQDRSPDFILIKSSWYWFFWGFLPRKLRVEMCMVFFCASTDLFI
jgi:hypothetical protein